jgi:hypothetical protein
LGSSPFKKSVSKKAFSTFDLAFSSRKNGHLEPVFPVLDLQRSLLQDIKESPLEGSEAKVFYSRLDQKKRETNERDNERDL